MTQLDIIIQCEIPRPRGLTPAPPVCHVEGDLLHVDPTDKVYRRGGLSVWRDVCGRRAPPGLLPGGIGLESVPESVRRLACLSPLSVSDTNLANPHRRGVRRS